MRRRGRGAALASLLSAEPSQRMMRMRRVLPRLLPVATTLVASIANAHGRPAPVPAARPEPSQGGVSATLSSAPDEPRMRSRLLKLWLSPPLTRLVYPVGITVLGVSAQFTLQEFWAIEVGGARLFEGPGGLAPSAFARVGVTPMLGDHRNVSGRGWTTQALVLAGFCYFKRSANPDGHYGTESTLAVRADVGLDFTRHATLADFSIRLSSGFGLPVSQTRTGDWKSHLYTSSDDDLKYVFDVGVDFGIAVF